MISLWKRLVKYLLYVSPGFAVNVTSENLKTPFDEIWIVCPVKVGIYVTPDAEPVILRVAVDELSDLTICPNWSTNAK